LKIKATTRFRQPEIAYRNFQQGLGKALTLSKEELDRRVAEDDAARTADRVQRGYAKRGPKPKTRAFHAPAVSSAS
jgi:hypothetical protein